MYMVCDANRQPTCNHKHKTLAQALACAKKNGIVINHDTEVKQEYHQAFGTCLTCQWNTSACTGRYQPAGDEAMAGMY